MSSTAESPGLDVQVTVRSDDDCASYERILQVAIPASEVDRAYESAFQALSKRLHIKGFRKGKVPDKVARQRLTSDQLAPHVSNQIIPPAYRTALRQKGLSALGKPRWSILENAPGKDLLFEARIQVMPLLPLEPRIPTRPEGELTPAHLEEAVNTILADLASDVALEQIPPQLKEGHALLALKTRTRAAEVRGLSLEESLRTEGRTLESLMQELSVQAVVEARLEILYRSLAVAAKLSVKESEIEPAVLSRAQAERRSTEEVKQEMLEDGSYRILAYHLLISRVRKNVLSQVESSWHREPPVPKSARTSSKTGGPPEAKTKTKAKAKTKAKSKATRPGASSTKKATKPRASGA